MPTMRATRVVRHLLPLTGTDVAISEANPAAPALAPDTGRPGSAEPADLAVRAALVARVGHRSKEERAAAVVALGRIGIAPAEAPGLEALLTRKPADLRRAVLSLLVGQSPAAVLSSVERLWHRGHPGQRDAACELLATVDPGTPGVSALAETLLADRPTTHQRERLEDIVDGTAVPGVDDPGLGLFASERRQAFGRPALPPQRPRMTTETSAQLVSALDGLVEAHRDTPVVRSGAPDAPDAHEAHEAPDAPSVVLADLRSLDPTWCFALEGSPLDGRTVADVYSALWDDRPDHLREAGAGVDALRARVVLSAGPALHDDDGRPRGPEWWTTLVQAQLGPPVGQVIHPDLVASLLDLQIEREVGAEVIRECIIGLGVTLASVPWPRFATLPQRGEPDRPEVRDREWRQGIDDLVWSAVLRRCHDRSPEAFTERQVATWWKMLRFVDRPFPGVRGGRTDVELTLHAHAIGVANDDDVYDLLLGNGPLLGAWTRHRRGPLADRYPAAVALARRVRDRVVEIERRRGELPTSASPFARRIQRVEGVDLTVDLFERLGRSPLVRGGGSVEDRDAVHSHLIRVSHPAPGDDAADLTAAAEAVGLPLKRLVELAMFSPQWADLTEEALGWTGLADAVWWHHAHTKDQQWPVTAEARGSWAALSAERTTVSAVDLIGGGVDVAWFRRAHRRLGPRRWQAVHDLAALATSGTGHVRAQLAADAMLGRLDEDAVKARIRAKRHQDSVRILGLLPLPRAEGRRRAAVLARYEAIRAFEQGRRPGARRGEGEGEAVRIGIGNLARAAGGADPLRFALTMEAAEAGDLADGPPSVVLDDVTIVLSVDQVGAPELIVTRGTRRLASVPSRLRKSPAVAELHDRRTRLTRQAVRVRRTLEAAMVDGARFDGTDLAALDRHPVLAAMLELLVFVDEAGRTVRRHRGGSFVSATGDEVRPDGPVRLVHPVDLVTEDRLGWQKTFVEEAASQPFEQVFRDLYVPAGSERSCSSSRRWSGEPVGGARVGALLAGRGWLAADGGGGSLRVFHAYQLTARVSIEGTEDRPMLGPVAFSSLTRPRPLLLDAVPPIVFSETMRDLDLVVSAARDDAAAGRASSATRRRPRVGRRPG